MKRAASLRLPSSTFQPPDSPGINSSATTPGPEFSTDQERVYIRRFIRQLLEAFVDSAERSRARFNLGSDLEPAHAWDLFFRRNTNSGAESVVIERSLRHLQALHRTCIEDGADRFARVLLPPSYRSGKSRKDRIYDALAMRGDKPNNSSSSNVPTSSDCPPITVGDAYRVLGIVTQKFRKLLDPCTRMGSFEDSLMEAWAPDWRCQAEIWSLINRLGTIAPPAILDSPYSELKEAAFACLFERDYINKQWQRCSFWRTLFSFIPLYQKLDADISWLGVALFVSLPLTGFVFMNPQFPLRKWGESTHTRFFVLYWGVFGLIFVSTALGMCLFYAAYRSKYSERIMRRAAVGTRYEAKYKKTEVLKKLTSVPANLNQILIGDNDRDTNHTDSVDGKDANDKQFQLEDVVTDSGVPSSPPPMHRTATATGPASSAPVLPTGAFQSKDSEGGVSGKESEAEYGGNKLKMTASKTAEFQSWFDDDEEDQDRERRITERERSLMSPDRAIGFGDDRKPPELSGTMLRLYQASMFVQRIYGSKYFDESWMFGLSEESLYTAIRSMLAAGSTLGRQYAAFSFTAIAVASRGVPDVTQSLTPTLQREIEWKEALRSLNFGIFSFLCALTFICGITAAVLSDMIITQTAFTGVSKEGTAHLFANKFGFFIRVVGSLNSTAGMFLSTSLLHFLLGIYEVNAYAVLVIAGGWLILGTLVQENFFSSFHFWRMSEILDDVNVIAEPDVFSPSPLIGALQFIMAMLRRITNSGKKRSEQRKQAMKFY